MQPHAENNDNAGGGEERLARALAAQRARLLRRHAHRLRREDLDECLSQAALELVPRARREDADSEWRPALALEQRFLSRVIDRRRALAGRSQRGSIARAATGAGDAGLDEALGIADGRPAIDEQVVQRDELRRLLEVIEDLSDDQRLLAIHRLFGDGGPEALRRRQRWSVAKYEKTSSRARAALLALRAEYDSGERCRRLAPDLHAAVFGGATAAQRARAARHVRNCRSCSRSASAACRRRERQRAIRALARAHGGATASAATLETAATEAEGGHVSRPRRVRV